MCIHVFLSNSMLISSRLIHLVCSCTIKLPSRRPPSIRPTHRQCHKAESQSLRYLEDQVGQTICSVRLKRPSGGPLCSSQGVRGQGQQVSSYIASIYQYFAFLYRLLGMCKLLTLFSLQADLSQYRSHRKMAALHHPQHRQGFSAAAQARRQLVDPIRLHPLSSGP